MKTKKGLRFMTLRSWAMSLGTLALPLLPILSCCGAAPPESAVASPAEPPPPDELALLASPMGPMAPGESSASTTSSTTAVGAPSTSVAAIKPATSASSTPAVAATPTSSIKRLLTGSVSNAAGKPLGGAVVYLEDGPKEPGRGEKAGILQKEMLFMPFLSVIVAGGSVTFANNDPFPHNIFSPDNEKFNLGMVSQSAARSRPFKQTGVYRVMCNLHPGMLAYVVVVPSSYFAVSDGKGKFTMKDVPEGTWKLAAWARDVTTETQPITISGADATASFTLKK